MKRFTVWACVLIISQTLAACGARIVRPGGNHLRAQLSGVARWSFDCDPAREVLPGAPPIDLAQRTVVFRCGSGGGGEATAQLSVSSSRSNSGTIRVTLTERAASGAQSVRTAWARIVRFLRYGFSGATLSGEFTVEGDVNGNGEFLLVSEDPR